MDGCQLWMRGEGAGAGLHILSIDVQAGKEHGGR